MRGKFHTGRITATAHDGFNEARALCAGSFQGMARLQAGDGQFNEARALCAGSF